MPRSLTGAATAPGRAKFARPGQAICGTVRAMDEDGYFGEEVAATYDDQESGMFSPATVDAAADVLAELAGGGRALELGIGTGRIALPLARRGVPPDFGHIPALSDLVGR